ncbi:Kinesin-like protein [Drosera capensis]
MIISGEMDHIHIPSADGFDSVHCLNDLDRSFPSICVDVGVVPEQKQCELKWMISSLEDEITGLRVKQRSLHDKIKEVLNQILDIKGSIRVFCRIRPYMPSERKSKHEPILAGSQKVVIRLVGSRKEFDFDKVFLPNSTQEDVFFEVKPILRSALDGHNVCILAYGQTGMGKTFTMDGTNEQPGIVPRALKELFYLASLHKTDSVTFSLSMLEVYMGNLKDLLTPRLSRRTYEAVPRCNLNIQTDPAGMVEVEGLTEVPIADFSKAIWWYNKGRRARSTSCTNVNDMSSRSHCLLRVTISRNHDAMRASKLWMVDLGGSERLLKTGAIGQTLDEGKSINLSLSALGDVIAALRSRRSHVPYRSSVILRSEKNGGVWSIGQTPFISWASSSQVLRFSPISVKQQADTNSQRFLWYKSIFLLYLYIWSKRCDLSSIRGDGSKVLMLVHASPCDEDIGETICSLSFAKRARAIESNQELSKELKQQKQKRLADLIDQLREAEEEYRNIGTEIERENFLLGEKKKLFLSNYPDADTQVNLNPPKNDPEEIRGTHQASENISRKRDSLPRFMTSTVASRERQTAAEREINTRQQTLMRSTMRSSSVQVSCSHSSLASSNAKQRNAFVKLSSTRTDSPKGNDTGTNSSSIPRSKATTSLIPDIRPPVSRHRRRMSNLT